MPALRPFGSAPRAALLYMPRVSDGAVTMGNMTSTGASAAAIAATATKTLGNATTAAQAGAQDTLTSTTSLANATLTAAGASPITATLSKVLAGASNVASAQAALQADGQITVSDQATTNLIATPETFAPWSNSGLTNVPTAAPGIADPFGRNGAWLLARNGTASSAYYSKSVTASSPGVYTLSVFVKANSLGNRFGIRLQGTYPVRADAVFSLSTGNLIDSAANTWTFVNTPISENWGNGWYRFKMTVNATTTPQLIVMSPTDLTTAVNFEAANTVQSDAYVRAPMLEMNASASVYAITSRPQIGMLLSSTAASAILTGLGATNLVKNSAFVGATVGTVGSGGTLPNGWFDVNGVTLEVQTVGMRGSLPYMRIRATKTATADGYPGIIIPSTIPKPSTQYTASIFAQTISSTGNKSLAFDTQWRLSGGFQGGFLITGLPSTWQRISGTGTTNSDTNDSYYALDCFLANGEVLDHTFEIACPMLNVGPLNPPVLTTGAGTEVLTGRMLGDVPSRNYIRNSIPKGAKVGTPGTLPTDWLALAGSGVSIDVAAFDDESVTFRVYGTSTANQQVQMVPQGGTVSAGAVAAVSGERITVSCLTEVLPGGVYPTWTGYYAQVIGRDGSGAIVAGDTTLGADMKAQILNGPQRLWGTILLSQATTAVVTMKSIINLVTGDVVDFLVKVSHFQIEKGVLYPTDWIPTRGVSRSRGAQGVTTDTSAIAIDRTADLTKTLADGTSAGAIAATNGLSMTKTLANAKGPNLLTWADPTNASVGTYYKKPAMTAGETDPWGRTKAWSFPLSECNGNTDADTGGIIHFAFNPTVDRFGDTTVSVWLKADAPTVVNFGIRDGYSAPITIGTTWQRYSYSVTLPFTSSGYQNERRIFQMWIIKGQGVNAGLADTSKVYLAGMMTNDGLTALPYAEPNVAGDSTEAISASLSKHVSSNQTTNWITDSVFSGATVGVIGSGGVFPTNMSSSPVAGLTREVKAIGRLPDGREYIDVAIYGTNTSGATGFPDFYFQSNTAVPATIGDVWSFQVSAAIIAGSRAGFQQATNSRFAVSEANSGGSYLAAAGTNAALSSTLTDVVDTRVFNNASTAYAKAFVDLSLAAGATVNVTYRFVAPQLEKGTPSAYVPTRGSAVTRAQYGLSSSASTAVGIIAAVNRALAAATSAATIGVTSTLNLAKPLAGATLATYVSQNIVANLTKTLDRTLVSAQTIFYIALALNKNLDKVAFSAAGGPIKRAYLMVVRSLRH